MDIIAQVLAATTFISLIAVFAALGLSISRALFSKLLLVLVGLSAGALMGAAFFHLIPEALEGAGAEMVFAVVISGYVLFFILERVLWHHSHKSVTKVHPVAYLNLIGDGAHNFIDGLIIAASFIAEPSLGLVTTFAVSLHEIPQELGDFGVLVYGGFTLRRAILLNFAIATFTILGGILGIALSDVVAGAILYLLAFAAGGFIYIASVDLVPELHRETQVRRSIVAFAAFLIGIIILWGAARIGLE